MAQDNAKPAVETVRVKVPPFWPDEPALWFAQLEGQFALANISVDATKYNYVISNLDYKYVTEIKDIIKNPPHKDKYDKVKTELITRLSSSQEQRVRQLLTHEDIGDRKPSQFLRHLQNLAGPNVPDDFIRSLWSSRLPTNIQVIVASQPRRSLDELCTLADTVNDVIGTPPQVHQTTAPTTPTEIAELKRAIADLTDRSLHCLQRRAPALARTQLRVGVGDPEADRTMPLRATDAGITVRSATKRRSAARRAIIRRKTTKAVIDGG